MISRFAVVSLTAFAAAACSDPYVPPMLSDMRMESGDQQTGIAGGPLPLPLVVAAFNQFDDPISGARVEFSAPSGSFDQSVKLSTLDGKAQAIYTLGPGAGPVSILASTLSGEIVVEFTAFAEMGDPAFFRLVSGNQQTGIAGTTLALPLRVRVTNQYAVGLSDVPVAWATQGRGTLNETSSATDADGYAEATLRLSGEEGAHTVTASAEGFFPVTFTAVATAAP